jgi:hypothetical protein
LPRSRTGACTIPARRIIRTALFSQKAQTLAALVRQVEALSSR